MKSARKHGKATRSTHTSPASATDDFVARHGVALVALIWCVLRAWQWAFVSVSPQQDVTAYFAHASEWMRGLTPYVQFELEYPPGALPVWWVPRLFADSFEAYRKAFAAWMLVFDIITLALLWRAAGHVCPADARDKRRAQTAACVLYVLGTAMLGSLLLQRYDPVLGCALMAWWTCSRSPKTRWLADVMLALGIWVKLMAVLVVPIYWLHLCVNDTRVARSKGQRFRDALLSWLRHEGGRRAVNLVLVSALLFLPFYLQAGDKLWSFLTYHRDRQIQVETTWASLFLLARLLFEAPVTLGTQFGAIEIVHPWGAACAKVAGVCAALALLVTAARIGRRLLRSDAETQDGIALDGAVAMLLGFMAFNKVLSPQYLLWIAPLAALATQRGERTWRLAGMGAVFVGTGLNWVFYYPELFAMEPWPITVMALRNVVTLLMWAGMSWPLSLQLTQRPTFVRVHRYVPYAAAALFMTWAIILNMSATVDDDVWLRLSEGAHALLHRQLDGFGTQGSANGAALTIPRAWLSGVLLHTVRGALGDRGITALAALLAASVATLLAAMVPRAQRLSALSMGAWATAVYVVALRALNWPDALSLLAIAGIMMCLEGARRVPNVRWLIALPSIQLVWINADAHAVIGPMLVMVVALSRLGDTAARKNAVTMLGIAAAMLAVTCLNPDGASVFRLAGLTEVNAFARAWMWQWVCTFEENIFFYWPWLFMALLLTAVFGLILRVKERPADDVVTTLIAGALAYHAGVLASVATIILWPACVRSVEACKQRFAFPTQSPGAAWASVVCALLLLGNTLTYGYANSAVEHRVPLSAGVGGDLPYAAALKLREERVQGALFNEFSEGGLLAAMLAPQLKPVIDSRIEAYAPEVLQEYQSAYVNAGAFAAYVQRHHVRAALFYRSRAAPAVLDYLDHDPSWEKAMDADKRVLYVRRGDGPHTQLSAY